MPVAVVFGMVRTAEADRYAAGNDTAVRLDERTGRDAVRIGELLRRGWDVITVSLGAESDRWHINRDFTKHGNRPDGERFVSLATEVRNRLPPGAAGVDAVFDDWVYIPVGAYGHGFYDVGKWENVAAFARSGLLNVGCLVYVPLHVNAVEGLLTFGLDNFRAAGFLMAYLAPNELRQAHPMWASVYDDEALRDLYGDERRWLQQRVRRDLTSTLPAAQGRAGQRLAARMPAEAQDAMFLVMRFSRFAIDW